MWKHGFHLLSCATFRHQRSELYPAVGDRKASHICTGVPAGAEDCDLGWSFCGCGDACRSRRRRNAPASRTSRFRERHAAAEVLFFSHTFVGWQLHPLRDFVPVTPFMDQTHPNPGRPRSFGPPLDLAKMNVGDESHERCTRQWAPNACDRTSRTDWRIESIEQGGRIRHDLLPCGERSLPLKKGEDPCDRNACSSCVHHEGQMWKRAALSTFRRNESPFNARSHLCDSSTRQNEWRSLRKRSMMDLKHVAFTLGDHYSEGNALNLVVV